MSRGARVTAWLNALAVYRDRRVLSLLFFGFSSGLPLALTASTLAAWLTESGVSLTSIGLFAAVGVPYSLKFLWSPVIDRARLPFLSALVGHRRSWMLLTQIGLIAAILGLGASDPAADPATTALLAVAVAILSASQDIVIDAYRVEILKVDQYAAGAVTIQGGYRIGMLVSGAGALFLADQLPWLLVYAAMAAFQGVGVIVALLNPEPEAAGGDTLVAERGAAKNLSERLGVHGGAARVAKWLYVAVISPFREFVHRGGSATAAAILLFVVLYKFGDALAGVMTTPFLLDLGFTKSEIAEVVKVYGLAATFAGLAAGGVVIRVMGFFGALMFCGVLQLASNAMFALLAAMGADMPMLMLTIAIENFTGGMGSAVFVAYLSGLCNLAFTATQYALLSSLAVTGRTILSTSGGALAEWLGWAPFFLATCVAAAPGLLLLLWLRSLGLGVRANGR